jgi:hypothetical protein
MKANGMFICTKNIYNIIVGIIKTKIWKMKI